MTNLELRRTTPVAGTLDEPNRLHGYAARFNDESEVLFDKNVTSGPFVEVILPGAFSRTLRDRPDILSVFNHDMGCVLGRTSAGTLTLEEDEVGLRFDNILPDTSFARDLRESLRRKDFNGCSFYGYVVESEVQHRHGQPALRTISDIELIEVTPATARPAYLSTSVALRSRNVEHLPTPAPRPLLSLATARFRLNLARS